MHFTDDDYWDSMLIILFSKSPENDVQDDHATLLNKKDTWTLCNYIEALPDPLNQYIMAHYGRDLDIALLYDIFEVRNIRTQIRIAVHMLKRKMKAAGKSFTLGDVRAASKMACEREEEQFPELVRTANGFMQVIMTGFVEPEVHEAITQDMKAYLNKLEPVNGSQKANNKGTFCDFILN